MFIIRGKSAQVVSESFDVAQHRAYTELVPKEVIGADSHYDLIAYIPGGYVKCVATFYRGCNALAMPASFVNKVWGGK